MKRFVSFFIIAALTLAMTVPFPIDLAIPASAETSGTTGDCTWTLNGTSLTISGEGAMEDYTACGPWGQTITEVTIGSGVTHIGAHAFDWCHKLKTAGMANTVKTIGDSAFKWCTALQGISIGLGVTTIGSNAFRGCSAMLYVVISDSVEIIGSYAFFGCNRFYNIELGNGVKNIGDYAFGDCFSLLSAHIPASVTRIGVGAFNRCLSMQVVTMKPGVVTIRAAAFTGNSKLTSIPIPHTATAISTTAFDKEDTLEVHADSYALTYAKANGFSYKVTDHTYTGEETVVVPNTCLNAGIGSKACDVCAKVCEYDLPFAPHDFADGYCSYCNLPDIQSSHPYVDNADQSWNHTEEGAYSVTLEFSEESMVEENADYIYIYDANDTLVGHYTGTELAGQTVTVPGDTVKIQLVSNGSANDYGFSVVAVDTLMADTSGVVRLLKRADGHNVDLTDQQADINGDGKANLFDVVRFLQLLNTPA